MNIQYDVSAAGLLKILGYTQPSGREWLEGQKEKGLPLPRVFTGFMELAYCSPLLATSNLWTGKFPLQTYYGELQEYLDDAKAHQIVIPAKSRYYPFAHTPREGWPDLVDDYLLIGSDYGGGEVAFGIRVKDLDQDNPPVFWRHERDPLAKWREDKLSLSGFLLEALWNVLNCVGYDTAERELEKMGWRMEEYFDPEKGDWVASKSVLKKRGIVYSSLKKYKSNEGGKVFGCYDSDLKVIYAGCLEEGEIGLTAINRAEAEKIFLDIDGFPEENA